MITNRFAGWLLTAFVALGSMAVQAQAIKAPDALIKEISSCTSSLNFSIFSRSQVSGD